MTLRVVGAGLGRTGTHSLKVALERLLGAPCYHMVEVFQHPEHVPIWQSAAEGRMPDWITAFERHNTRVRETVPAHRLLEWRATDGWGPLCAALGVQVPDEPFPVTNTKEEFAARARS